MRAWGWNAGSFDPLSRAPDTNTWPALHGEGSWTAAVAPPHSFPWSLARPTTGDCCAPGQGGVWGPRGINPPHPAASSQHSSTTSRLPCSDSQCQPFAVLGTGQSPGRTVHRTAQQVEGRGGPVSAGGEPWPLCRPSLFLVLPPGSPGTISAPMGPLACTQETLSPKGIPDCYCTFLTATCSALAGARSPAASWFSCPGLLGLPLWPLRLCVSLSGGAP